MLKGKQNMPELAEKPALNEQLNNREERFCFTFVNTGDKYKAFENARYDCKNSAAKAASVCRLLRKPRIKKRIKELEREYYEALGIDEKRILGNIAQIAFTKSGNNQDRLRALELLGKERAMWKDNQVGTTVAPKTLSDEQQATLRRAAIVLTNRKETG